MENKTEIILKLIQFIIMSTNVTLYFHTWKRSIVLLLRHRLLTLI
jgi:hypothetical protein